MNFVKHLSFIICISLLFVNFVFADPTDGCEMDLNTLFLTSSGDVFYNSDTDIGGFQFDVDGATVSAAAGGDAGDAGFTVSAGGSTVLGFSFTGATISADSTGANCGTLTVLTLSNEASGLINIVVSDPSAQSVDFSYYVESDCTSGIFDCAGVCDGTAVEDCAGICNGTAVVDECGVCDGLGIPDGACDCSGNVLDLSLIHI